MRNDAELDNNWDLVFSEGDISIQTSESQEAKLVIFANQGDWKKSPLTGAGFRNSRHQPITSQMLRNVKLQLDNIGLGNLKINLNFNQ